MTQLVPTSFKELESEYAVSDWRSAFIGVGLYKLHVGSRGIIEDVELISRDNEDVELLTQFEDPVIDDDEDDVGFDNDEFTSVSMSDDGKYYEVGLSEEEYLLYVFVSNLG